MSSYIVWLIAGFALIITELVSGTFYLLVLGIAAFAGAVAAWFGAEFWIQVSAAAALALAGVWWVHEHHRAGKSKSMPSYDLGQPVAFDSWVSRAEGMARVKYRGALWNASLPAGESPAPGDIYYIIAVEGNSLRVAKTKS